MRKRKEIELDAGVPYDTVHRRLIIELLLDIRDLLAKVQGLELE